MSAIIKTHFDTVPHEITVEILSYLTPTDLERVRRVCKNWNNIIQEDSIWTSHARCFGLNHIPKENYRKSILAQLKSQKTVKSKLEIKKTVDVFLKINETNKVIALKYSSKNNSNSCLYFIRYISRAPNNKTESFTWDPTTNTFLHGSEWDPRARLDHHQNFSDREFDRSLAIFENIYKNADIKISMEGINEADYSCISKPCRYSLKIMHCNGIIDKITKKKTIEKQMILYSNVDKILVDIAAPDKKKYFSVTA